MAICITQSSVQHNYQVWPVTEQHSHVYAPLSTRGHCGYTNRVKYRQHGESAGESGLCYTFGYWVFSRKHDIAILRWHSNGKHSFWKTFVVPWNGKVLHQPWDLLLICIEYSSIGRVHCKDASQYPSLLLYCIQYVTFLGWVCFGASCLLIDYEPVKNREALWKQNL